MGMGAQKVLLSLKLLRQKTEKSCSSYNNADDGTIEDDEIAADVATQSEVGPSSMPKKKYLLEKAISLFFWRWYRYQRIQITKDSTWNLIAGDDILIAQLKDGSYRQLTTDEYTFTYASLPEANIQLKCMLLPIQKANPEIMF